MQLCVDPQISNYLSKTFHISSDSPHKKCQQMCSMIDKHAIFAWAVNPNDTEKLFAKLQVSVHSLLCMFHCRKSRQQNGN